MDISATCSDCGFSGSLAAVEVHDCYVQEMGGRCEDYPCCGHTDGGGCQTRPEHTSKFWQHAMDTMDEDSYERMCEAMDRQEMGY